MEAADSPLTQCVQCEMPFTSNVLICVDCYRKEIEGFDKQIKNLSIEKEYQISFQRFEKDIYTNGINKLIKTATLDTIQEDLNIIQYERIKKELEDEIEQIKTRNKLLITQLSELQIKNSEFDEQIHSQSIEISLCQQQHSEITQNIKEKSYLINELTSVNILNSIYEISFENNISLINSKPINFSNCQVIAQIFKFFLSKHQKYSSSILIDLSQMKIYLTQSNRKYEDVGRQGIPIICHSTIDTVEWLNIIAQQMKRFGQFIQYAYLPQQCFPFKIEVTEMLPIPSINNLFLLSKNNGDLQAFKFLMYDLKYLINLQFYLSQMIVTGNK